MLSSAICCIALKEVDIFERVARDIYRVGTNSSNYQSTTSTGMLVLINLVVSGKVSSPGLQWYVLAQSFSRLIGEVRKPWKAK